MRDFFPLVRACGKEAGDPTLSRCKQASAPNQGFFFSRAILRPSMHIDGHHPALQTRLVPLPRPDGNHLVLMLRPLPLGFHRRLREHRIIPPSPPTRVARDAAGKAIRDANNVAVVTADERDPSYLADLELYHQRVAVLVAVESLGADPNVHFDTEPPADSPDWRDYADAVYREFERAHFTAGDLIHLCREACQLSNLLDDHLQATHRNFSPAPPPPTQ